MLQEKEAQELMGKFIELRELSKKTNKAEDIKKFRAHEQKCLDKFKYLIDMRTSKYKNFSNYEDLVQEGFIALVNAMKTYDPSKSIFFGWAHKYIATKVSRSANKHTTIKYPLKFAKDNRPYKEVVFPTIPDLKPNPEMLFETAEISSSLHKTFSNLSELQKNILIMTYGIGGEKPMGLNKISNKLNVGKINCGVILEDAVNIVKETIEL